MLYLYPDTLANKKALYKHVTNVVCLVYKRLTGENCTNTECAVCKETAGAVEHGISRSMRNYLTREKIKEIIESEPEQLWNELEPLYENISTYEAGDFAIYKNAIQKKESERSDDENRVFRKLNRINKKLKKVFSYATLSKKEKSYNLYSLAANLNQSTCTYCNRLFTNTIISEEEGETEIKISRPQFDHWFSQTRFPLVAVSFFNLIPSCTICNSSLKRDELFQIGSYYHPYLHNIENGELTFSYRYNKKSVNGLEITISSTNDSIKKVIDVFKIEEAYNAHTDELRDLIKLKQLYNDRYLNILANETYQGLKISKEELYRLAFGVYYSEEEFGKRPFSRLKKDILSELGVITDSVL